MPGPDSIDPPLPPDDDLGFRYHERKNGEVELRHAGRLAATLRGEAARAFLRQAASGSAQQAQQRMARLTGNYKRGNEGLAARHPRHAR